ncbi:hypothetical protein FQN57_001277 [Myotisia sp. PD_48]|nr:hypothetical protein FQN57_001277 [Myotisia sp. PD_48]
MVLPRPAAFRSLLSAQSKRIAAPRVSPSRAWQRVSRRGYSAQAGHEAPPAGSDLPWLIGSIAFTAPAAYYLFQSGPSGSGHAASHHDEVHGHESHAVKEPVEEAASEEPAPEPKAEEKPEAEAKAEAEPESESEEEEKSEPATPASSTEEDSSSETQKEAEPKETKAE